MCGVVALTVCTVPPFCYTRTCNAVSPGGGSVFRHRHEKPLLHGRGKRFLTSSASKPSAADAMQPHGLLTPGAFKLHTQSSIFCFSHKLIRRRSRDSKHGWVDTEAR